MCLLHKVNDSGIAVKANMLRCKYGSTTDMHRVTIPYSEFLKHTGACA